MRRKIVNVVRTYQICIPRLTIVDSHLHCINRQYPQLHVLNADARPGSIGHVFKRFGHGFESRIPDRDKAKRDWRRVTMRVGIIGAGMIGSTLAKLWVRAGHEVRLASRHPDALKGLVEGLGKSASAGSPRDAAEFGDVVMLTVPLEVVPGLAADLGGLIALWQSRTGY
jgi:hypothetical protein